MANFGTAACKLLTIKFDWTRAINSINNTIPEDNENIRDDCWQHHHARAATVVQGPFSALCIREKRCCCGESDRRALSCTERVSCRESVDLIRAQKRVQQA